MNRASASGPAVTENRKDRDSVQAADW